MGMIVVIATPIQGRPGAANNEFIDNLSGFLLFLTTRIDQNRNTVK